MWDKDRQLSADDPLRTRDNVSVCEAALHPTHGAVSLLFPVADRILDTTDPTALAARHRDLALAYVGNQYDRDHAFGEYFVPAAVKYRHLVAGKWTRTQAWPGVNFVGRVPFDAVADIYRRTVRTVLLLPDRYAAAGQMPQRLVEVITAGCLPLTPPGIRSADRSTPSRLHIGGGWDAADTIAELPCLAGTAVHADLLTECLAHLDLFRLSRQLDMLDALLVQRPTQVVTV